jgi:prepilin-type N-terminal cleavage/methylation domain-containing protein
MNAFHFQLRDRRGLTLIELVMSLLVFAILMVAVEASLVASTKAIPDPKSVTSTLSSGAAGVNRLTGELAYALTVTEMSANAITFTVPDRNGDGTPETIRYAWSGVAGDPLTRQFNGGNVEAVVPSVQTLALQYDKTRQAYYTTSDGPETLVFSYNNTLLSQSISVKSDSNPGEYFIPSLPSRAVSWRVSRVLLSARSGGAVQGSCYVQLRTATPAGTPSNRVLDQAVLNETTLGSSFSWVTLPFSANSGLDPNAGLCVVLQWTSDAEAAQLQKNTLSLLSSYQYFKGSAGGGSWTVSSLDSLLMYVYGIPSYQNAPSYNYYLQNVRLNLQASSNSRSAIATTIKLLNTPQVTGP